MEVWREAPTGGKKSRTIFKTRYDEGDVQVAVQWYEHAVIGEEDKWEMTGGPPATAGVVVNTATGVFADCFNAIDLRLTGFDVGLGKKDGYGDVVRQRRTAVGGQLALGGRTAGVRQGRTGRRRACVEGGTAARARGTGCVPWLTPC